MAKVKAAIAVKEKPQAPTKTGATPRNRNAVADVYLKTTSGVLMLIGRDGNEIKDKIEQDTQHSALDYRFFDDDKKVWAYWAVRDDAGNIKPPSFPDSQSYTLTASQLYAKAVSYVLILAHTIGLLRQKTPTMWDKMLKPTTIIMAIVGIMFVMGLMLLALTG